MIESYVRQHVVRGRLKQQHAPRGVVVEAATGIVVDKGSRRSARHVTIGPPPCLFESFTRTKQKKTGSKLPYKKSGTLKAYY